MKQNRTALILIVCAVLLAVGAFFLLNRTPEEPSMVRSEVTPPAPEPARAPDWVDKGQEAKPDYSAATAQPEAAAPAPAAQPEQPKEPKTIEVAEDKVVTFTFVESLSDFLLHRFHPRGPKGKPESLVSAVALNRYYGRELDGFAVSGDDIDASRKAVYDYAFNPATLKTLYALYAPAFMVHLVDTAANTEREYTVGDATETRTLTTDEIKVMLRLDARRIERTAEVLHAFADDPSILESAAGYRRAAKAVERANGQLQAAMAEGKGTGEASDRLKQAILARERTRAEIVTKLRQVCQSCPESELFYLSQWGYRRSLGRDGGNAEAFGAAAGILDDLAARFRTRADELE
ncbi:hypothetical protein DND132_0631 [Pseudodesulfovibrio mercurii]|uniref:Uncharacterized protein n=1 Tax=Pseudodesulfovibrio mercurii TaxID=641491 RepID=F0JG99_9BACT|nr:hypothetical protein [Pseudodesulfovibrio mercurii]EGB13847.1 hypothetical protein DND132_0631 [Pseudodesulfovibrio mercurii]